MNDLNKDIPQSLIDKLNREILPFEEVKLYPTWEFLVEDERGDDENPKVYRSWHEDKIHCLILRGTSSLCAYIGLPDDHPFMVKHSAEDYNNLDLNCHGGLTFSGPFEFLLNDYYYFGWDYAHSGDYSFYYDKFPSEIIARYSETSTKWTVEMVEQDMKESIESFKQLLANEK